MGANEHSLDLNLARRVLGRGLRGANITCLHQGQDGRYDFAYNLPVEWPLQDVVGKVDGEWASDGLLHQFANARQLALESGESQLFDFELGSSSNRRQFEACFTADYVEARMCGMTVIVTDVSEQRAREMTLNTLLREVSHRSKNLLAIVQSVAAQTAHHSDDVEDFLSRFRGRLQSLAGSQDMVTESDWRGTLFQSLVLDQLRRLGQEDLSAIRITGDNPLLTPNAALHIGLAIHELGANAVLHGALAPGGHGSIWLDAVIGEVDGQEQLVIQWQESGLHLSRPAHPPRFGTLVLDRIVPASVGGTASFAVSGDLVSYRLTVPASNFEA